MKPSVLHPTLATRLRTPFPNVRCNLGHPDAPGYCVCVHVIAGEPASDLHYRPPTGDKLGWIVCAKPPDQHNTKTELTLECAACAIMRGHLPDSAVATMKAPSTHTKD